MYFLSRRYKKDGHYIVVVILIIGVFIKKMEIEYKSDWMSPTIELMKSIESLNEPTINEEMGSIDYLIEDEKGKRLIRAMVDENNGAAPAYVVHVRDTVNELDEKYDEITIISKSITNAAHDIVTQEDNLSVITPNTKHNFNLIEVLSAIQKKTLDLCEIKCGKAPETKEDCKGKKGRKYVCDIRRISDDATFHATMKWKKVLLEDFNHLCELERNMESNTEVN